MDIKELKERAKIIFKEKFLDKKLISNNGYITKIRHNYIIGWEGLWQWIESLVDQASNLVKVEPEVNKMLDIDKLWSEYSIPVDSKYTIKRCMYKREFRKVIAKILSIPLDKEKLFFNRERDK